MILNQTPISSSSSFQLEVKCLLFTLVIVFLINTPMRYVKSDKESDFAAQLKTLENTLILKRNLASSFLAIGDSHIATHYFDDPAPFLDLTNQLLATQPLIKSMTIVAKTPPVGYRYQRWITTYNRFYSSSLNRQQTQLLLSPQWGVFTEFKAIYRHQRHIGYLVLEIDLNEFSEIGGDNILLINQLGTVYSSSRTGIDSLSNLGDSLPHVWQDLQRSNRFAGLFEYDDFSFIYRKLDLLNDGKTYLVKVVDNHELVPPYFYLILMFGSITAGVSLYLYRIRKDKQELTKITFTDELSGLHNRHYLKKVSRQLKAHHRYHLCILDIDHFKLVNDKYGHDIGDQVIKRVASVIKSRIRLSDYAFRFGGEEFVVVIKTDSAEQAVRIFDRIREDVALYVQAPKVTISGGVWPVTESVDAAIKHADRLLYMAKEQGRNTILSEAA